ncbi:hypothetical protein FUAX_40060 (plasmid) [Fulvitalea axinellae]|uniref:Uncharacterized protein n=1 Tax=Fulvitalea axinellae TaxID=1182444 RepID=A0AAU9CYJ2_9BACT|nr:hypothetical protein FUAX_40060 [Fulvitalea axinellae]
MGWFKFIMSLLIMFSYIIFCMFLNIILDAFNYINTYTFILFFIIVFPCMKGVSNFIDKIVNEP